MAALCSELFGDRFVPREDLIAVSLSNVNPQNHLGMALCNFTRIEKAEAWANWSGLTPAVGRLIEALDAERLAVAAAFGASVRTRARPFSPVVRRAARPGGRCRRDPGGARRRPRTGQPGYALHHRGRAVRPGAQHGAGPHRRRARCRCTKRASPCSPRCTAGTSARRTICCRTLWRLERAVGRMGYETFVQSARLASPARLGQ